MTEAQLQQMVLDLARWAGYLTMHITDSRKSNAIGFPDLVLCHQQTGRVLFVELKSATGKLRPGQEVWLAALSLGGHEVHVWRPADWESGVIRAALAHSIGAVPARAAS